MHQVNTLFFMELKGFLDLSCPAYIKDIYGVYIDCNLPLVSKFGFTKKNEIIGKSNEALFSCPTEIKIIKTHDQEVIQTEKPIVAIESLTIKDQSILHMLSHKLPYKNSNGKLMGILCTSISINSTPLTDPLEEKSLNIAVKPGILDKNVAKREKQCLYYLVRGMTAKEIGRILNLSPRTIEFYIENMKKKFSCSNRIGLIAKAYDILQDTE